MPTGADRTDSRITTATARDDAGDPPPGAGSPDSGAASGWLDVAKEVVARARDHHVALAAAGVAFFGFLAFVPALAALLSVYGLVADPQDAAQRLEEVFSTLPEQTRELLSDQISSVTEASSGALSLTLVVSLALSLWAASSGVAHLVEAVNLLHDDTDDRSFAARRGLSLALTLGVAVAGTVALVLLTAVIPAFGEALPDGLGWVADVLGWLVIGVGFTGGLSVLYRVAPVRGDRRWRWVSPGSVAAVVGFVAASLAFSTYVSAFGSYDETYGSLAAVVVLLLWLFISASVVLLAGELDAVLEADTAPPGPGTGRAPSSSEPA